MAKISFHSYKTYLECPRKFKLHEDWVKPPEENKYFAIFGIGVQKFFEDYCNKWGSSFLDHSFEAIDSKLKPIFREVLQNNYVNWKAPFAKLSATDIYRQALTDIQQCLDNIDIFKKSKSEVSLKVLLKNKDLLIGKVDFLLELPSGGVAIIDGKGTDKIGKNVHEEQLLMYALLYYMIHKKLPEKLGFLYYRLRHIEYIEFDLKKVDNFRKKLLIVLTAIRNDTKFEATPSPKSCMYCDYKSECEPYLKMRISRMKKSTLNLEGEGVHELGF